MSRLRLIGCIVELLYMSVLWFTASRIPRVSASSRLAKMNRGFRRRRHMVPDQNVDLHVKQLIFLRSIQFSKKIDEDFLNLPIFCVWLAGLWWSNLVVCTWIPIYPCIPWSWAQCCRFPFHTWEYVSGSGLCFGQCPACSFPRLLSQTLNPSAESPVFWKHTDRRNRIALCSGLLKSNTLTSVLLPQVLLPCSFVEFSSTLWSPFNWTKMAAGRHAKIHNVNQRKKITPFTTRETF